VDRVVGLVPAEPFGNKDAREFISEHLSRSYELHYALLEPDGPRTGGTGIRPLAAYDVLTDMQKMLVLTVRMMLTFLRPQTGVDIDEWKNRFTAATASNPP
jgi:hypothetical protein